MAIRPCFRSFSSNHKQDGAVLIVSLLILLVVTVIGVSNMQSSSIQLKMASNQADRQRVFQEAEVALRQVEQELEMNPPDLDDLQDCPADDASCFDVNCAGGLCFNGTFNVGSPVPVCSLALAGFEPYWVRQGEPSAPTTDASSNLSDDRSPRGR